MSLATDLWTQFSDLSVSEVIAVVFAILYLLLAIRQNIWCWLCAGVSTSIYVSLYFGAKLYMESILNVFYLVMAFYGWAVWRSGKRQSIPVVIWPAKVHLLAATAIMLCAALSGFVLSRNSDAAFPYIDSATTFGAIWATFLVARKVLENWWYWLIIDAVSVVIYWSRDLPLTAALFVIYIMMIPFGLMSWTRSLRQQSQKAFA